MVAKRSQFRPLLESASCGNRPVRRASSVRPASAYPGHAEFAANLTGRARCLPSPLRWRHARVPRVPRRHLLVGVGDPAQRGFGEASSSELNAVRQTVRREATRHADRRHAGEIHRHRELGATGVRGGPGLVVLRERSDLERVRDRPCRIAARGTGDRIDRLEHGAQLQRQRCTSLPLATSALCQFLRRQRERRCAPCSSFLG